MNKLVFVLAIAMLFSATASAQSAPYYEGRWRVASSEPLVTTTKKGNVTRTETTKLASNLAIKICPNSKKTGRNLALLLPIGLAVGSTPVSVKPNGSISATIKDGAKRLRFDLQRSQHGLAGTVQFSPNESNPNPVRTPVTFERTGKC